MKKLTIKLKITLWFTSIMILLCAIVFAFIAFVSNSATTHEKKASLTSLIDKNAQEIQYKGGKLEIDNDYVAFQNGIYSLLFYEDGEKISGYAPYEELENESFENGVIHSVNIGGETYLIYDKLVEIKHHQDIWVRGILLESGSALSSSAFYWAVLFTLPLLIILASVGSYLIAGHSLRPIQKIRETAEQIEHSGDLSKRIEIEENGDELHHLAGSFNRMFDRLETNFDAERHFTSDASHELRTPVSIILAQCEYAFENASGEEELYEAIGSIQKQGYRMSHLIESLLNFTRMEQQTENPALEYTNISVLIHSFCQEHLEADEKNIQITENIQPDIIMKVNPSLFSRMLANLVHNAYRYGRENGRIDISLKQIKDEIILSVSDNGIGISAEELPMIWNRFYRVDKSRSTANGAGLGLGLAMVKQIAQLLCGRVSVTSEPGKGSIFTVTFKIENKLIS